MQFKEDHKQQGGVDYFPTRASFLQEQVFDPCIANSSYSFIDLF